MTPKSLPTAADLVTADLDELGSVATSDRQTSITSRPSGLLGRCDIPRPVWDASARRRIPRRAPRNGCLRN